MVSVRGLRRPAGGGGGGFDQPQFNKTAGGNKSAPLPHFLMVVADCRKPDPTYPVIGLPAARAPVSYC
jgi:hypothetical protein